VVRRLSLIVVSVLCLGPVSRAGETPLQQLESGLSDLVYRLSRSVVSIEATRAGSGFLPGTADQIIQTVVSTGLVIDSTGHILVNATSVVGFDQIQVSAEERSVPGVLEAVDYRQNIAILKSNLPVGEPVRFSEPGVCAGQMVLSVGNDYGLRVSPSIGFCAGSRDDGLLQFSVPIGPNSIGGGVFDLSGKLLGVIVGAPGDGSRAATAVPSCRLPEIIKFLLTKGSRQAGFIGVATAQIEVSPPMDFTNGSLSMQAGLRALDRGLMIASVLPGSPAARAGIVPGDLVLTFDGEAVSSSLDLASQVSQLEPGTVSSMQVMRHGNPLTVRIEIGQRPVSPVAQVRTEPKPRNATADSLRGELSRLKEEISRVERRLQSIY
jgi:S1-C subfamily serine protease